MPYLEMKAELWITFGKELDFNNCITNIDPKTFSSTGSTYYKKASSDCRDSLLGELFTDISCNRSVFGYSNIKNTKSRCVVTIYRLNVNEDYIKDALKLTGFSNPTFERTSSATTFNITNFPYPPKLGLLLFLLNRGTTLWSLKTNNYILDIIDNRYYLFSREGGDYTKAFWTAYACYDHANLFIYRSGFLEDTLSTGDYYVSNIAGSLSYYFNKCPWNIRNQVKDFVTTQGIVIPDNVGCNYDPGNSFKNYIDYMTGIRKLEKEK